MCRLTTEAEAIAKLFNGEAEAVEGSLEFIEVAEDLGLPADEYRTLPRLYGIGCFH